MLDKSLMKIEPDHDDPDKKPAITGAQANKK